ncbi:hypothetical protein ACQPX6_03455 [Actinomycetospora sp. CA-101289]|uniref:hypothetical protein n=1 Tax=Actinomycetospora sp. CA-101289 TaxID=3239893 RepID=UPI003D979171
MQPTARQGRTRAVRIPPDEEEVARQRAEDERKRRAVTIDLHTGSAVTAIVAAHVVAVRFRASRD